MRHDAGPVRAVRRDDVISGVVFRRIRRVSAASGEKDGCVIWDTDGGLSRP
jgi:hypothetical protein